MPSAPSRRAALLAAVPGWAQSSRSAYLAMFDRNGDGRVSEPEYVGYLDRGFVAMDANHDGVLEPSELPGGRGRAVTLAHHEADLRRQLPAALAGRGTSPGSGALAGAAGAVAGTLLGRAARGPGTARR